MRDFRIAEEGSNSLIGFPLSAERGSVSLGGFETISYMLGNMTATFATQIEIDAHGVAWLAGTRVKVVEVVLDKVAHGWSPEEIHFQHPHLSLAQIHGALTYYYENQTELDAQIARSEMESSALAAAVSDPALRQRLSELKRAR